RPAPAAGIAPAVGAAAAVAPARPPVLGGAVPRLRRLAVLAGRRPAGDRPPLVPAGLPPIPALEGARSSTRSAVAGPRGASPAPSDGAGEPDVGRAADRRRVAPAGPRRRDFGRFQVPARRPPAAVADLEDVPAQPRRLSGVHRFLRRADGDVPT